VPGGIWLRDADESALRPISEEELAGWLKRQGSAVVSHRGRFWVAQPSGFFHPVHWLARMRAEEAERPALFCWGYRTTLAEEDMFASNGTIPVHVLRNVRGYDLDALSSKRRNKVKNCMKHARIVQLLSPDLLLAQGAWVVASAFQRTGYRDRFAAGTYEEKVDSYFTMPGFFVLAGLVGEKLGGYVVAYAINRTLYVDEVHLASEYLSTNIGTGLIFTLLKACGRSDVAEVVYGLHAREDAALCHYKSEMGFEVFHYPSKHWFLPGTEVVVRSRRPHAYYRLTGRG